MLDRKLLRDLAQMKGQATTIALVIASGTAILVAALGAYASLRAAQEHYYAGSRFADVFAALKCAPASLEARFADLPGVAQVETRLVFDITIDLPATPVPLSGRAPGRTGHFRSLG